MLRGKLPLPPGLLDRRYGEGTVTVGIATSQSFKCGGAKAINTLKELAEKNGALQAGTKGSSKKLALIQSFSRQRC